MSDNKPTPFSDEELKAFYDEPKQRQAEVTVNHRLGFWSGGQPDVDDITTEMIAEADAYLEAHIQWRMSADDAELTEKVRRETLEEAAEVSANAFLLHEILEPGTGPFTIQQHAADEARQQIAQKIRTLSTTPTPERSN
jgi:hypothetical protein